MPSYPRVRRTVAPIRIVYDDLDPPQGPFWTSPDQVTPYSRFTTTEVAHIFFNRSMDWLRYHARYGHVAFEGEPLVILRSGLRQQNTAQWRLYDIELLAHGLLGQQRLTVDRFISVITAVKVLAANHGFIRAPLPRTHLALARTQRRVSEMAIEKVTVTRIRDDLTGEEGARPRSFAIDAIRYQLDLTDANWAQFLLLVDPYVQIARPGLSPRREVSPDEVARRARIRTWAKANGYAIGKRGRIPADIEMAYEAAVSPTHSRR